MDLTTLITFSIAMTVMAISPGPGLAAVLSRSLSAGAVSGIAVISGLVFGDVILLALAIGGLSVISMVLGPLFVLVKFVAAGYLIYLGIQAIRGGDSESSTANAGAMSFWKDIGFGATVTLGNPKALLFYGAFIPTFFEISEIGWAQFMLICAIIALISFAVYVSYIYAANRAWKSFENTKLKKRFQQFTGLIFIGSGVAIATRT